MRAIVATSTNADDPLSGLYIGEHIGKSAPTCWTRVHIRAAALNHHDVWTLKGVATSAENLPIVLGSDGVGITDDGREVIIHAVLGNPAHGDETLDPKRTILSEVHDGTQAEYCWVPEWNLIDMPSFLTWEQAAALPTSWLTAYRMLMTKSHLQPGGTVLIQGGSGGVSTALIQLARAAGYTTWVTTRDAHKHDLIRKLGADAVFTTDERLPGKVDAVMESIGQATWNHSMRALKPGGRIVVCGATSGPNPPADLNRLFFLQLEVVGSTMGTKTEFIEMLKFMERTGVRPTIQDTFTFDQARTAYELMEHGKTAGKLILLPQ